MFEWQHAHTQHALLLRPPHPLVRNAHAIFIQWHREFAYHNVVVAVMIYLFSVVFCLRYIALFLRLVFVFVSFSSFASFNSVFRLQTRSFSMRTPNMFAFISSG